MRAEQRDLRARDADRERTIELLDQAYVDGQLNADDHRERVEAAMRAATMGHLADLGADLQPVPAVPPETAERPKIIGRKTAKIAAVAGAVIIIALAIVVITDDEEEARSPEVPVRTIEMPSSEVPTPESNTAPVNPYAFSEKGVRRYLRDYESKFKTSQTLETTFYPEYVISDVPARGSTSRFESWEYLNGEFGVGGELDTDIWDRRILDLEDLDISALLHNGRRAERTVGVDDGALTHVNVSWSEGEPPTVTFFVSGEANESGSLITRLDGTVVGRYASPR